MVQIEMFLRENSVWMLAAGFLLIFLQQAVALRRIKKTKRQLEQVRKEILHSVDMLKAEKERNMPEDEENVIAERTEAETELPDKKEAQEKLIDEVLSEVFS